MRVFLYDKIVLEFDTVILRNLIKMYRIKINK